jgi:NAD(P)H-hydrate epimerase
MFSFALTREQVRSVDRRAVEEYGMSSLVLMENAGRGVVDIMISLGVAGPVTICCGKGNNGGDGFVIARHLENRGKPVRVLLFADPAELRGDAAANWHILSKMDVVHEILDKNVTAEQVKPRLADADWIVDALLGTGTVGEPHSPYPAAIQAINTAIKRVLAVDLPSGLDCDTGVAAKTTVIADHTCTFVAVKPGFLISGAERYTGRVHVIDIGAPKRLVKDLGKMTDSGSFDDAS